MGTYGPGPLDTLTINKARSPEDAKEPPWAIEEDRPRSYRPLAAPGGLVLAMEILLLVIGVGWALAWLFGFFGR